MKKMLLLFVAICASYSAMANATVTQKEWRWRNDDGDESSATWKAPQEQTASVDLCTQIGQNVRLRINMLVNPDPANSTDPTFTKLAPRNLSYSTSPAGPWTQITTTSSDFVFSVSSYVTDNTPTTQQLTSSTGVPGPGSIVDGSSINNIVFMTPQGIVTCREYEWVIQPTTAAQATTYYFTFEGADSQLEIPSLTLYGGPTASTVNVSACDNYTSPSGNYIWTSSGTYNDTIPNAAGCDSVITTNLTINTSTFHSMTASSCSSYTSPSGNYTWTASGTYNDTIPNAAGCDSIITIDLTILNTFYSMTASACNNYVSPSGTYTWTTSGTYNDTIPNAAGCDSIITIDLTILNTFYSMTASACNSYVSPSGTYTWTASGTYNDTIPNAAGCDSIITIDLTIQNTFHTMTVLACNSYVSPSGIYTWTASGMYNDTIPNAAGCDSIITTNLTINTSTFHSMTASACNNYVSPSGNYTWTASGTYNDTIPNAAGCDSIITIDLTILNTFHAMTATACNNYVSPSGNYTWTASGTYNDTIPNAAGCDSIITIDLTIQNTFYSMTASACNNYVSPSGNYTWTASGTYNDTIPNAAGCDSIITIDLTIQNTFHVMTASACNNYVSPSGNYTWTTSGTYNDTIPNAAGCDSIITINLAILSTSQSITEFACNSYLSPSGHYTWVASGNYSDTIPNAAGCDSVIFIGLTVSHSTFGTDVQTACGSYTWIDGNTYTSDNTTATHTLTNAAGCDSIVTLNLTINQVNTATSVTGITISAAAGADSYQWINCDDLSEIQGATDASFTATANGSYAVVISDNNCQDTSSCTAITNLGLDNLYSAPTVTIAPNPTSGLFNVQFTGSASVGLTVMDLNGKTVFSGTGIISGTPIDLSSVGDGVYILQISTGNGTAVQRIVKH